MRDRVAERRLKPRSLSCGTRPHQASQRDASFISGVGGVQLKPMVPVRAAQGWGRLVGCPAMGMSEIDRLGDHVVADHARQCGEERLAVDRGAGHDPQFVDPAQVLHDPAVLGVLVIERFVGFLGRRHGSGGVSACNPEAFRHRCEGYCRA